MSHWWKTHTSLPTVVDLFPNRRWTDPISWYNIFIGKFYVNLLDRIASIPFPSELDRCRLFCASLKTCRYDFFVWQTYRGHLRSRFFGRNSLLRLLLGLRCIEANRCFIDCYGTVQNPSRLGLDNAKHNCICDKLQANTGAILRILFHTLVIIQNRNHWTISTKISRTYNLRWTIIIWWIFSILLDMAVSIESPEVTASVVLQWTTVYPRNWGCRLLVEFIELTLGLSEIPPPKVLLDEHMKTTFSIFAIIQALIDFIGFQI